MLYPTRDLRGERIQAPPALDAGRDACTSARRAATAARSTRSASTARCSGSATTWESRFRNTPPVLDASGRVFVALDRSVYALDPDDGHIVAARHDLEDRVVADRRARRFYLGTARRQRSGVGDRP